MRNLIESVVELIFGMLFIVIGVGLLVMMGLLFFWLFNHRAEFLN